ncbi:hypothetical protein UVI_02045230 [Ustilaginoidea virens]|uniref:MutL C-terminal dimerisation domain-containing protein n=1 Tax=Ustilaginoidea virens TaxID=1159556 RepID=A0A1B5L1D9_USTVR|nr:hypothetical protein UVI_02045230 [Ustilaginoidea virens]
MSIRPLPQGAVDKIQSSAAITSLNDVVCGLVKNSLDASSSKLNIHLNFVLGNCTVDDDGTGIDASEFEETGGLAKLHHSSKMPPNATTHGRHGNFIASVAAFSLLTVVSRRYRHETQAAVSLHNGIVLSRRVPPPPDERFETFAAGTRVSVRDLFGSMPVRAKQRANLFSERARIDKEWDALIKEVASLLLAWPSEVSILLRESNTQREVRLRSGSTDIVSRTSRLFTQTGLAGIEDAPSWVPVSASSRHVRIKGAISQTPVATRRCQIMSLGIRPIPNNFGTNVLYDVANKIFKASSFGLVQDEDLSPGPGRQHGKAKKGIERWPMFYFEIHLLGRDGCSALEITLGDSQHTLQAIIDLLRVTCHGFLKKHCLQPKRIRHMAADSNQPSTRFGWRRGYNAAKSLATAVTRPSSDAAPNPELTLPYSPFDGWNHIKVGTAVGVKEGAQVVVRQDDTKPAISAATGSCRRLAGESGAMLRRPFDKVDEAKELVDTQPSAQPEIGNVLSGAPVTIGTGQAESAGQPKPAMGEATGRRSQALEGFPEPSAQEWLQDVLRCWKNPVFELTEIPIPTLHQGGPDVQRVVEMRREGPTSKYYSKQNDVQFEAVAMGLNGRLSRKTLSDAEVLGQVDRKFILLQLPLHSPSGNPKADPSSALVMLDQHAADERCRLERLMSDYFPPQSGPLRAFVEILDQPITLEVSARERELLDRFHTHFDAWGIAYTAKPAEEAKPCTVKVTALPPSILRRCRSDPGLVMNVLRKEIWKLEERGMPPPLPVHKAGNSMVSSFHNCPHGILELLHSRACRSK